MNCYATLLILICETNGENIFVNMYLVDVIVAQSVPPPVDFNRIATFNYSVQKHTNTKVSEEEAPCYPFRDMYVCAFRIRIIPSREKCKHRLAEEVHNWETVAKIVLSRCKRC